MINNLRDLDSGFKTKLSGLIIDGKEIPVLYIDPEKEFVPETYPAIVFYRAGAYPDYSRYTNDKFYDGYVENPNGIVTISEREAPEPYNIYYGIRLYYEFNGHGVQMNNFILSTLKRGSYLPISEEQYEVEFVSYKNPDATYRQFGEFKGTEKRQFIDQYLYKVAIELDLAQRKTIPLNTQGVDINLHFLRR